MRAGSRADFLRSGSLAPITAISSAQSEASVCWADTAAMAYQGEHLVSIFCVNRVALIATHLTNALPDILVPRQTLGAQAAK